MASEIKVNTIKDLGGNTIVSSNGSGTFTSNLPSTTLTGSTNNTITTVTGANAIQGEADLTFDGDSLLVKNGASGGSGANANANELVVENSDHGGISILTPYDKTGAIYFGDGSDDNIGMIEYPHDANCLKFTTNAAERMRIDSAGKVGIGEDAPQQKLHIGEASSNGVYQVFTNDTTGHTASNGLLIGIDNSEDALIWNYENQKNLFWYKWVNTIEIANNGYLKAVGVYTQNAGDSANVVVDSSGNLYRSTSALKYKQDVRDLESIDISSFRPVRYKSKSDKDDANKDFIGFIADEFHDAGLTELVSYSVSYAEDDTEKENPIYEVEGFNYDRLTAILTKSLQNSQTKITALETANTNKDTKITALETSVADLTTRLEALENA